MKALKYVVLALFSLIWVIALSYYPVIFPKLYRIGLLKDEYRFGDFYRLAYLPQFKELLPACTSLKPPAYARPVHLYVLGDSFTEKQRIDSNDFAAEAYHHLKWDNFLHFKLDTAAVNIVLMESVERHFRQHFEIPPSSFFIPDTATYIRKNPAYALNTMKQIDHFFEASRAEGQIELLLFSNPLSLWIKELKASFTYRWFNRFSEQIMLSEDGTTIVYYLDTDTLNFPHTAGFSRISEARIDSVVNSVNATAAALKQRGFDQVILSVIPNKSTIIIPEYGTYNRLIERVQENPRLEVPYLSVIDEYRQLGRDAYLHSDSHWSCAGRKVWLDKTNQLIRELVSDTTGLSHGQAVLNSSCLTPGSIRSLLSGAQPPQPENAAAVR